MKIYVAGTDARNKDALCRAQDACNLYSYMDSKKSIRDWDDSTQNERLIVDSGGHSYLKLGENAIGYKARKKLPEVNQFCLDYMKFIELYRYKKFVWVELDLYSLIGHDKVDDMEKRVQDIGISGQYCRVYHPKMDGGSLETIDKWVEEGHDFIFVGNDSKHLLDEIFLKTRDKIKVHGLALTKLNLLHRYPFWSADSTTPLSTIIFGKYTKPIMNYWNKDEIIDMKSVWAFQEDEERLGLSIAESQKTARYFTELWKRRGIEWGELKF